MEAGHEAQRKSQTGSHLPVALAALLQVGKAWVAAGALVLLHVPKVDALCPSIAVCASRRGAAQGAVGPCCPIAARQLLLL